MYYSSSCILYCIALYYTALHSIFRANLTVITESNKRESKESFLHHKYFLITLFFSLLTDEILPYYTLVVSTVTGEYNMRLGVLKELRPRLVATFTEKSGSCEGTHLRSSFV